MEIFEFEERTLGPKFELKQTMLMEPRGRAKTALRLKYEAEGQLILKKFGGLAGIQNRLALSSRKICQILLVDPSSWSRWIKDEATTPPHILRALEWYLALQNQYPELDARYWLYQGALASEAAFRATERGQVQLQEEIAELKNEIQLLRIKLETKRRPSSSEPRIKKPGFLQRLFLMARKRLR